MATAALILLVSAAGCSTGGAADGPRKKVCGHWLGRAEVTTGSGPWYVDVSSGRASVTAAAESSPTLVRVSSNCQHGAGVHVSDPAVIGITAVVTGSDGGDVVVSVAPKHVGRATLTATVPGGGGSVAFTIIAPRPPPTA